LRQEIALPRIDFYLAHGRLVRLLPLHHTASSHRFITPLHYAASLRRFVTPLRYAESITPGYPRPMI
jgi:hypothetical protein